MNTFGKKEMLIQLMLLEYLLIRLILQLILEKELEVLLIQSTPTEKESANVEDNIDEIIRQSNVDRVNAMRHHYWF